MSVLGICWTTSSTLRGGGLPEPTFVVIEPFRRHYYELVDPEDIQSRNLADLYGAVMAHWQTARKFTTGRECLRVYNPNLEQHGWHSDHTVVEIVNDDMPFLVDSVTMAVNRLGLAMHSAIHPVFSVSRDATDAITRIALGHVDAGDTPQSRLESFIHFEVDRCGEAAKLDALRARSRAYSATCAPRWRTGRRSWTLRVRPSSK